MHVLFEGDSLTFRCRFDLFIKFVGNLEFYRFEWVRFFGGCHGVSFACGSQRNQRPICRPTTLPAARRMMRFPMVPRLTALMSPRMRAMAYRIVLILPMVKGERRLMLPV